MASASTGGEVCSNGDEVVHYGGNSDDEEVLCSDSNDDEVLRFDGNGDGEAVLCSDGNDHEVLRSDSNGKKVGDKMLFVEDDGKLPFSMEEDDKLPVGTKD